MQRDKGTQWSVQAPGSVRRKDWLPVVRAQEIFTKLVGDFLEELKEQQQQQEHGREQKTATVTTANTPATVSLQTTARKTITTRATAKETRRNKGQCMGRGGGGGSCYTHFIGEKWPTLEGENAGKIFHAWIENGRQQTRNKKRTWWGRGAGWSGSGNVGKGGGGFCTVGIWPTHLEQCVRMCVRARCRGLLRVWNVSLDTQMALLYAYFTFAPTIVNK